jgi:hypothetical protein
MLRVTFADTASRDAFAERFKIDAKVGEVQLDIDWHFLQFAKLDDKALDYDEVAVLTAAPNANSEREFVVKGNPETFGAHATVVKDLGNGFYLVKSTDGTLLGDHVDSIEHNSSPMKFLGGVSTVTSMDVDQTTIDPTSSDAQWARLRVASRYRPLSKVFGVADTTKLSKPELIIMDSGIDFTHPEFDVEGIETEDFYSLPVFNGSFADDIGHGTAVASMACGKNLGVSQHVTIVNVKIGGLVNGSAYNANLIEVGEAIDAILARISANPLKTRVINMSWGVPRSAWLDSKVESLQSAGATVVCASGNQGISVEDISPAGIDSVITVGSIDKYDIPSGFNNISPTDSGLVTGSGLSLDIFAPGEQVIIAKPNGGYVVGSGTSFASPLVAGVATEWASLFAGMVPYADLKKQVLDAATKDALLFEDDRFSEEQNRLIYLLSADQNATSKYENQMMYLGHIGAGEETTVIVADLNSQNSSTMWKVLLPDYTQTFSVTFADPAQEALYGKYVSVNSSTGILTINNPVDVVLPETTNLVLVELIGEITTQYNSIDLPKLFFFHTNPLFKDTIQSDITLALTDTNSISFYEAWGLTIK